jgi:hypothetical protein
MKKKGEIVEENETMKKELDKEQKRKCLAEYRLRRLEEEVEMGKELVNQAKKAAEESKEEYNLVIENIMIKMNVVKVEAVAKGEEIADL